MKGACVKEVAPTEQLFAEGSQPSEIDRMRTRAVWLYFVEGHTQNEIATMLGLNRVAVVRLIADARRRNEVRITISAPLAELASVEQAVQDRYGIARVIAAPVSTSGIDPVKVIAAAAGSFINATMRSSMTVGVGWGRTLYNSLPFIAGHTLEDFRVVSLLGGIAAARRFNPAEFAWQFAELFQGEGYLIPAPAIVDSPETKHALLEHCGLAEIFHMADHLDMVLLSVGSMSGSPPATAWATSRRRSAASSSRPARSATCSTTSSTSRAAGRPPGQHPDHVGRPRAPAQDAGAGPRVRRPGQASGAPRRHPRAEPDRPYHRRAHRQGARDQPRRRPAPGLSRLSRRSRAARPPARW